MLYVGTYFVGHYYQVLQTQPDYAHQFYSDRSTLLRVYGYNRETATSMLQIHALVMLLNYTGIEIKTVHALESWDRGEFCADVFSRASGEGYFLLNDIFHFLDDQPNYHHLVAFMTQNDFVSKMNSSTALREQILGVLPYTINYAIFF
ncbi:putative Ras GTPase-activating protein-binding protein [Helianthus anomalus]